MAPQETAKLDELLEQVSEHRTDFRVFRTEILGGWDEDKPSGRLPILEAASRSHERRLRRIEGFVLMILGAAALIRALAWGAESLSHVVDILR